MPDLETVSKRNPGALRVCFEILEQLPQEAAQLFAALDKEQFVGSELWDLYKACNHSVVALNESVHNGTALQHLQAIPGSRFYVATQSSN